VPQTRRPILVVDDDPRFRKLVADLLGRIGCTIREAASGEEALAASKATTPALVLLDVQLPDLSGYEVCRELRDMFGEGLPIVFVSGTRVEPYDRTAGLLVGGDDYILKPFDPDELLARVRRLLARSALQVSTNERRTQTALTARELEVLELLVEGLRVHEMAERLFITKATVGTHVQRVLAKLGVHSRAEAVAVAYREGLLRESRVATETRSS
jgi:two-component system, NarL family, nitrate/nitrite response regulator NarL